LAHSGFRLLRIAVGVLRPGRREHPSLTREGLLKAREFNCQRYHFQGIDRYAPDAAYARGIANLKVLANLIPGSGYLHGPQPTSIDPRLVTIMDS
jgi:hypothetical protein